LALRKRLRDRVIRGSIDVSINLESTTAALREVVVDEEGARAISDALCSLAETLSLAPPTLESVLKNGDFLRVSQTETDEDETTRALLSGIEGALTALDRSRLEEGAELAIDIDSRLDLLSQLLTSIEGAAPKVKEAFEARLRQRLEEAMGAIGKPVDEGRVASELVIFADRCDVNEETVRARTHIDALRATLRDEDEPRHGKRLEFLAVELGREFNTIGSKCREAGMASDVVAAKVELERIREQVLNIA
jgi:uncharacterized protein (TIGR00255 family)